MITASRISPAHYFTNLQHSNGSYAVIEASEHVIFPTVFWVTVYSAYDGVFNEAGFNTARAAYEFATHTLREWAYTFAQELMLAADEMIEQTRTTCQPPIGFKVSTDESTALRHYEDHMRTVLNMLDYLTSMDNWGHYDHETNVYNLNRYGIAWRQEHAAFQARMHIADLVLRQSYYEPYLTSHNH